MSGWVSAEVFVGRQSLSRTDSLMPLPPPSLLPLLLISKVVKMDDSTAQRKKEREKRRLILEAGFYGLSKSFSNLGWEEEISFLLPCILLFLEKEKKTPTTCKQDHLEIVWLPETRSTAGHTFNCLCLLICILYQVYFHHLYAI